MRYRSARSVGALLLVAVTASVAIVGTEPAATAGRACSDTATHRLVVGSEANWYHLDSYRTPSGQIEERKRFLRENVRTGRTTLVYDMCKVRSTGEWEVQRMLVRAPHDDLDVTRRGSKITSIKPAHGDYGYGVFIRTRSESSVSFNATRCTKKPMGAGWEGYSVLKGALSLPWRVPHAVSVGMFVVGQALPDAPDDKYWCARMGEPLTLKVRFRASDGKPLAKWGKVAPVAYVKTKDEEFICNPEYYSYCARSDWQTVALKKL